MNENGFRAFKSVFDCVLKNRRAKQFVDVLVFDFKNSKEVLLLKTVLENYILIEWFFPLVCNKNKQ